MSQIVCICPKAAKDDKYMCCSSGYGVCTNPWYPLKEIPYEDAIWNMKNLPNAMRCILTDLLTQKEKFDAERNMGGSICMDEDIARLFRSKSPYAFS